MRNHDLYVIKSTAKDPQGYWEAEDDLRITGYSEPKEYKAYYLASSQEVALAHWKYWIQFSDKKREISFVSIEKLGSCIMLLEMS